MEIDRELISEVRRLITGANVHEIGTWVLIYECLPDSPRRAKYEAVLREFVRAAKLSHGPPENASPSIRSSEKTFYKSKAFSRRIESILKRSSD